MLATFLAIFVTKNSKIATNITSVLEIEALKRSDPKGADYTGNVAETKSHPRYGVRPCRPWNEMFGKKMPEDGKYHNFCRNPDGSQRAPFCWVKEGFPGPKFGYCDIPDCVSILFISIRVIPPSAELPSSRIIDNQCFVSG